MESVFYGFENENIMKTKEEILKEATKSTLNINEGSPLHDAVMKAMEEYAQQQVKNCSIPAVVRQSEQLVCSCGSIKVQTTGGLQCPNNRCSAN